MGKFEVTMPDGSRYVSDADTADQAHADVLHQWSQDSTEKASTLGKVHQFLSDPLNQVAHGITAGLFDKGFDAVTGKNSADETAAGADRMGPVATVIARASGAVMLPSAVPRAVAAVGGGPLVRGLVGAGTAGLEGGAYGGVNAWSEG